MPAKSTKSVMGNKVNPYIKAHANDDVQYGGGKLPAGVIGVAQLKECYFGKHEEGRNKGKPFFRAMGVVVEPTEYANFQTSIFLPYYATDWADEEESVRIVMNEIKRLAGKEALEACETDEDVESVARSLEDTRPYFKFATVVKKPQIDPTTGKVRVNPETGKPYEPGVKEYWNGTQGLENYGQEHVPTPTVKDKTPVINNGVHKEVVQYRDDEDLDSLAKRAKKDEEIKKRLTKMAIELGYTEDEVDETETWEEVVTWIKGGKKPTSKNSKKEAPKIDDTVTYTPVNKSGGKMKPVECIVSKIDRKNETVTLTRLDNKKEYEDIEFAEIVYDE